MTPKIAIVINLTDIKNAKKNTKLNKRRKKHRTTSE